MIDAPAPPWLSYVTGFVGFLLLGLFPHGWGSVLGAVHTPFKTPLLAVAYLAGAVVIVLLSMIVSANHAATRVPSRTTFVAYGATGGLVLGTALWNLASAMMRLARTKPPRPSDG